MIRLDQEIEAKYEVLAVMGEGGMGAVYKVRHRHLDQIRVIKLIREKARADENLTARFLREAKTAARLRHPNIAEVIDYDITAEGTAFMVMEFIDGVNLRDFAARARGGLDSGVVIEVALQTLSALHYLHGQGFLHRDISPDNLMLTRSSVVKLIDLGIAKAMQNTRELTVDGHFIGKVRYASPDQLTGGAVDPRSDLYSLGIVMYELLTGQAPITGSDYKAIIAGHLTRPPRDFAETDPRERIPPPLRAAILKALAKDPADRYASAAAFAEELRSISAAVVAHTVAPADDSRGPSEQTTHAGPAAVTRPIERSTLVQPGLPTLEDSLPAMLATAEQTARTSVGRRGAVLASSVSIAVILAIAAWMMVDRQRDIPQSQPARAQRTPATQKGELVLNGLPWAEVTQVVGPDGRDRVTARPLYTPTVLTLEPGTYKVQFSNPISGRNASVEAVVQSGRAAHYEARLDDIDAAAWLRSQ